MPTGEKTKLLWQDPEYRKRMLKIIKKNSLFQKGNQINKGKIPWNKGKKLHYPVWNKDKRGSQIAWNKNTKGLIKPNSGSFKKGQSAGSKNVNWKNNNASYSAIHHWITSHKGKPKICEHCGATNKRLNWANKNHKYRRVLKDYISLCCLCHIKYDYKFNRKKLKRK